MINIISKPIVKIGGLIAIVIIVIAVIVFKIITTGTFEYNGYYFQYNKLTYNFFEQKEVEEKKYVNDVDYKDGYFSFLVGDNKIKYSLRDKELPPTNALNDIYPIQKEEDLELQIIFNTDKDKYGFEFVVCSRFLKNDNYSCVPASTNYESSYNYGQIPTSQYLFEQPLDVMGMEWSRASISINDKKTPTQQNVDGFLEFYNTVRNSVKSN